LHAPDQTPSDDPSTEQFQDTPQGQDFSPASSPKPQNEIQPDPFKEIQLPTEHRNTFTPEVQKPVEAALQQEIQESNSQKEQKPSRARTYVSPNPSKLLMRALGPVSRYCLLMGPPLIRDIPLINKLPGARGTAKISEIDLPQSDIEELQTAIRPNSAAFLAPNHPEFLTDWLIDKEISTVVAPDMASWADYSFVNMPGMQKLWLKSNLISNAPDAKMVPEYGVKQNELDSLMSALRGDATLLHPEGHVSWTGDHVHSLLPGIGRMPVNASQLIIDGRGDKAETAYIVPIVWKLRFPRDVSKELHREMKGIEKRLGLPKRGDLTDPAERFLEIQKGILERHEEKFGLPEELRSTPIIGNTFFARQEQLSQHLLGQLVDRYGQPEGHRYLQLVRLGKSIKTSGRDKEERRVDEKILAELKRLNGFTREVYGKEQLTQEQMAESLKRIRSDLFKGKWYDELARTFPVAIAERVAHIRSAGPIEVTPEVRQGSKDHEALAQEFIKRTHTALQSRLDALNEELAPEILQYASKNPFL
jgi:hypothetical protein